jgi:hypothetical protein
VAARLFSEYRCLEIRAKVRVTTASTLFVPPAKRAAIGRRIIESLFQL